jgi:hypothetical protein
MKNEKGENEMKQSAVFGRFTVEELKDVPLIWEAFQKKAIKTDRIKSIGVTGSEIDGGTRLSFNVEYEDGLKLSDLKGLFE